jgi:hypothetical protein
MAVAAFPLPLQNVKEQARERFYRSILTCFTGIANGKLIVGFFAVFGGAMSREAHNQKGHPSQRGRAERRDAPKSWGSRRSPLPKNAYGRWNHDAQF